MCLDKQNRRHLPLRAIQQTGSPPTASRHCSFWINQQGYGNPVLIPLPSLSPSYFLSLIWLCSLFLLLCCRWETVQECFLKPCLQLPHIRTPSPSLSLLVLHDTKLLSLPQNQSLYRLDELVMSHLLISVQLAHLAQSFTAEMLHLKKKKYLFPFFLMNSQHLEPAHSNPCELLKHTFFLFFYLKMSAFFRIVNFCLLRIS